MRLSFLAALLLVSPLFASEASITGPDYTVPAGKSVWLELDGIDKDSLTNGEISVFPRGTGAQVRVFQELTGRIVIWFEADKGGNYTTYVVAPYIQEDVTTNTTTGEQTTARTAKIRTLEWTIQVGQAPNPPPVIEPPIDPTKPPADPPVAPPVTTKADRVTYVYEKDQGITPRPVQAALQQLNAKGILATQFEQDATTGTGSVPVQYKIAREAAIAAGLPALVVQSGNTVLRVIRAPTSDTQVLEAVK